MTLRISNEVYIPTTGIWTGRQNVRLITVRRHNQIENLQAVKETVARDKFNRNPEEQLCLIENPHNKNPRIHTPVENRFLEFYLINMNIIVIDPIVNPFTKEIADLISINRTFAATSVLIFDHLKPQIEDHTGHLSESDAEEIIRQGVEEVALEFGISSKSIRNTFSSLPWFNIHLLTHEIDFLASLRQKLIKESNIQSRVKLTQILDQNHQPNVLIVAGGEHDPVFAPSFDLTSQSQETRQDINPSLQIGIRAKQYTSSPIQLSALNIALKNTTIETLAATDYPRPHFEIKVIPMSKSLRNAASKRPADWRDFVRLEAQLGKKAGFLAYDVNTLLAMDEIVSNCSPKSLPSKPYSKSNLMLAATDNPGRISGFVDWLYDGEMLRVYTSADIAARILKYILTKIGDSLTDEAEIIKRLLNSPTLGVREIGAEAAWETCKHSWRRNIYQTGLIDALGKETNPNRADTINHKITAAIAQATVYSLEDGSKMHYLRDERLETETVKFAKRDVPALFKSPSIFLLKEMCERSNHIDCQAQSIFIDNIDSEDYDSRNFSLIGIRFILGRKSIEDRDLENKLLNVLIKGDKTEKISALYAIGEYQRNTKTADSRLGGLLVKQLKDGDADIKIAALYAIGFSLKKELIQDPTLPSLILECANQENDPMKQNAFFALSCYLSNTNIADPELRTTIRHHCKYKVDGVRANATMAFADLLSHDPQLDNAEIQLLLDIGYNDPYRRAQVNATYALAVVVKNRGTITTPEHHPHKIHVLCKRDLSSTDLTGTRQEVLNAALKSLEPQYQQWKTRFRSEVGANPAAAIMLEGLIDRDDASSQVIDQLALRINNFNELLKASQESINQLIHDKTKLTQNNERLSYEVEVLERTLEEVIQELERATKGRNPILENLVLPNGIRYVEYVIKYRHLMSRKLLSDLGWHNLVRIPFLLAPLAFPGATEAVDAVMNLILNS